MKIIAATSVVSMAATAASAASAANRAETKNRTTPQAVCSLFEADGTSEVAAETLIRENNLGKNVSFNVLKNTTSDYFIVRDDVYCCALENMTYSENITITAIFPRHLDCAGTQLSGVFGAHFAIYIFLLMLTALVYRQSENNFQLFDLKVCVITSCLIYFVAWMLAKYGKERYIPVLDHVLSYNTLYSSFKAINGSGSLHCLWRNFRETNFLLCWIAFVTGGIYAVMIVPISVGITTDPLIELRWTHWINWVSTALYDMTIVLVLLIILCSRPTLQQQTPPPKKKDPQVESQPQEVLKLNLWNRLKDKFTNFSHHFYHAPREDGANGIEKKPNRKTLINAIYIEGLVSLTFGLIFYLAPRLYARSKKVPDIEWLTPTCFPGHPSLIKPVALTSLEQAHIICHFVFVWCLNSHSLAPVFAHIARLYSFSSKND